MKRLSIVTLLFFFCFAQTVYSKEADKPETLPELKIIESTHSFPSITEGVEIIHDFTLKNVGTAPLDIVKVKPG